MKGNKKSKLAKGVNKMNVWLIKMGYRNKCRIDLFTDEETGVEMFKVHANLEDGTEREFTGKTMKDLVMAIYGACSDEPEAHEYAEEMGSLLKAL